MQNSDSSVNTVSTGSYLPFIQILSDMVQRGSIKGYKLIMWNYYLSKSESWKWFHLYSSYSDFNKSLITKLFLFDKVFNMFKYSLFNKWIIELEFKISFDFLLSGKPVMLKSPVKMTGSSS